MKICLFMLKIRYEYHFPSEHLNLWGGGGAGGGVVGLITAPEHTSVYGAVFLHAFDLTLYTYAVYRYSEV